LDLDDNDDDNNELNDENEIDGFNLHSNIRSMLFRNLTICPISIFFVSKNTTAIKININIRNTGRV
jgi:hypothetical protein